MSEWNFYKEKNQVTRDVPGIEDRTHIWTPGLPVQLSESSWVYEYDVCLAAPLCTQNDVAHFAGLLDFPIQLVDERTHRCLCIVDFHLSKFRQTRGTLYTYTNRGLMGMSGPSKIEMLRWPSAEMRNMKTAYLPRTDVRRPDGTVRRNTVPPFAPRPPLVGIQKCLSDIPSLCEVLLAPNAL